MVECFAKPVAAVHNMMGIASVFGLRVRRARRSDYPALSLVDPRGCSGSAMSACQGRTDIISDRAKVRK
jgi:hypothetical protein